MGCGKSTDKVAGTRALLPGSSFHSESVTEGATRPHRDSALRSFYLNRSRTPLLSVEYVYGYLSRTRANNVFYLQEEETVVYPCGAVAVLLNTGNNTQRYLGGGEINAATGHSRAVVVTAVSPSRDMVATGEEGLNPLVCVWRPADGLNPIVTLEPGHHCVGIAMLGFSHNTRYLAIVDCTADQTFFLYDWRNRHRMYSAATGVSPAFGLCWTPNSFTVATVSAENVCFWTVHGHDVKVEKGHFDTEKGENRLTTVQFFSSGSAVTGDIKGRLHLWTNYKEPSKRHQILSEGKQIRALAILGDQIVIGGEDNKVHVYSPMFKPVTYYETPAVPVSVDMVKDCVVCGLENGMVVEFGRNGRIVLMDAHSVGDLHSIAIDSTSENLISTGEDNQIKSYNIPQHRPVNSSIVEVSLPNKPISIPKVVAISTTGNLAICHNDGHVTLRRNIPQINHILGCMRTSETSATACVFSHTGKLLALGTSDGIIYIYDVIGSYSQFFKLEAGDLPIISLEWNNTSDRLLSIDSEHVERLWNTEIGSQLDLTELGFMPRFGHFQASVTAAPATCFRKAHSVGRYAQGNGWGLVEMHVAPFTAPPSAYRLHSGEVHTVFWSADDSRVLSASGPDATIVQWRVTDEVAKAAREGW